VVRIDETSSTKKLKISDLDIPNLDQIILPTYLEAGREVLAVAYSTDRKLQVGFISSGPRGLDSDGILYKDLTFPDSMV